MPRPNDITRRGLTRPRLTRPGLTRSGVLALAAASLVAVSALASCNDDGRTLRPARPEQNASVSTTAPATDPTITPGADGGLGAFTTVAGLPTVAPAAGVSTTVQSFPAAAAVTAPWEYGGEIDVRHTCDGENISPSLTWTTPPDGTVEIAITVTDDDAPDFVHWTLAALDPLSTALGEGRVPEFAIQGLNSSGTLGYTGPCPPEGEVHTYHYTVFFLGQQTELPDGSPGLDLLAAIRASAFDSASVTGTYSRPSD